MNEILQQRIEEAAKFIAVKNAPLVGTRLYDGCCYDSCIEMAEFLLKNQWISVEEALPPVETTYNDEESGIVHRWSKWVLIRTREGGAYLDSYVFHKHIWTNNGEDVTHWMNIPPVLEGGE